jgi:ferrous iron transport protein A
MIEPNMLQPLTGVKPGRRGVVAALEGGRTFQQRLTAMGLPVGAEFTVIRSCNGGKGPTLVKAGETRLAIGYGMASHIMVSADPI